MDTIKVKLDQFAIMPDRAHEDDAGLDIFSPKSFTVAGCETFIDKKTGTGRTYIGSAFIDTGVHIEIPKGYVGILKSKSGLNCKYGIISDGVIDSGYTGSICAKLYNLSSVPKSFDRGDKICQLVILPCETPTPVQVYELEPTERGDGGFGSTGR